jgi:hypothetical protein
MGSGATVSGTWPATPRIALAFAHCSCVLMGSLHGLAIRLPVPRKSHELRRDGSRVANITPSVADKGRSTKRARLRVCPPSASCRPPPRRHYAAPHHDSTSVASPFRRSRTPRGNGRTLLSDRTRPGELVRLAVPAAPSRPRARVPLRPRLVQDRSVRAAQPAKSTCVTEARATARDRSTLMLWCHVGRA